MANAAILEKSAASARIGVIALYVGALAVNSRAPAST
jgi:hypothetical protein